MLPAGSEAIAQMYVEGRVASVLNAGASSKPPLLRSATPLGVPFTRSSNLDCSQVRVPSASAMVESKAKSKADVLRAKWNPRFRTKARKFAGHHAELIVAPPPWWLSRGHLARAAEGEGPPRQRAERRRYLLHIHRQHLCAGDHVIQRFARGFIH